MVDMNDIDNLCGTKLQRNFCVQKQWGKEEDKTACCTGGKDELGVMTNVCDDLFDSI